MKICNDTFSVNINIENILTSSNFIIVNDHKYADVIFIIMQNTTEIPRLNIKLVGINIDELQLSNTNYFLTKLSEFIKDTSNKKFIIYTRWDQSTLPSSYESYFLKYDNCKLFIKDYLTNDYDNGDFLLECRKLLCPKIENYFRNKGYPVTYYDLESAIKYNDRKQKIPDQYLNKLYLFNLNPKQYLFWKWDNNSKILLCDKKLFNEPKIFNVFFCKHQRSNLDGIARRYLLDVIMPYIKENVENVEYFESLHPSEYKLFLSRSKIVISPYGMGERIDDDLIAPLYNTIVIKPKCNSEVYDYTNLFTNKKYNKYHKIQFTQHIVYCKNDYSDLLNVINDVIINYDTYLQKTIQFKNECLEFIKTDKYEKDFIETLNDAIND